MNDGDTIKGVLPGYHNNYRTPRVVGTLDLSVLPLLSSVDYHPHYRPLLVVKPLPLHYHLEKLHSSHSVVEPTTTFKSCKQTPQVVSSSSTTPFRGTTTTTEATNG